MSAERDLASPKAGGPETMLDLQAWCRTVDGPLAKPFVQEEYRYATDGRAMVRVPAPGEPTEENPRVPCARNVFAPAETLTFAPWPADWETWETMEIPGEREECPECHDDRAVCPDCDGDGTVECVACGQDRDCLKCDGKGHFGKPCKACEGRGYTIKPGRAFHLAAGAWVAERFLRRVASLPNLHYACQDPPAHKPVFFRFDGGEAAMMPVTPKEV